MSTLPSVRKPDNLGGARVALIDYGMCNLFSVHNACLKCGLSPFLATRGEELLAADIAILPGVGAFGEAINNLRRFDLISPIMDFIASGRLFVGICLGMQLLMTESEEFGFHRGLDLIPGTVRKFHFPLKHYQRPIPVPQIGWNAVYSPSGRPDSWEGSLLEGIRPGEYMYFVHSFFVEPREDRHILSLTRYGDLEFSSTVSFRNIVGMQFHPEKSGVEGLRIYQNLNRFQGGLENGTQANPETL